MSALNLKLLRELWHLRGQMISIAMVVAGGVMTVVTLRGTYESLVIAQDRYYNEYRFASVWSELERAPDAVGERVRGLPGVSAVETRVTFLARLDLPDLAVPGLGLFVSIPERRRPMLNDLHLRAGRYVAEGGRDEVIVSAKFAGARGLAPGDTVRAVLNGRARALEVVGIAISPEHTYAVPPGSFMPDDERYGVLWISRAVLGPVYDMEGAFNQIVLTTRPGADEREVIAGVDRILERYGGLGAYGRDRQTSHRTISDELKSNRTTGTAVPIIFLGVAAFLLNLVLGRLIATQRTEIGVLKAFGYRDSEIGRHFLLFALAPVAVGALVGTGVGAWLGGGMVNLYREYFDFPVLEYVMSLRLVVIAVAVGAVAAWIGAGTAVRSAVALHPAEAMRPESPASFRPGWLERVALGRGFSSSTRMILRNVERQPIRSFLSALGVAFSVAILVVGLFMFGGVDRMMDLQFRVAQREDLTVSFQQPLSQSVLLDLANIDGVDVVEPVRVVPVRFEAMHRKYTLAITGMAAGGRLRRIVSASGAVHPIPAAGIVMSEYLAESLGVLPGDMVTARVLEGSRPVRELQVVGTVDDFLGLGAWMDIEVLHRVAGGGPLVSGAHLAVRSDRELEVIRELQGFPVVAGVASPRTMLESFQRQMDDSLMIAVSFMLGFAAIIATGIIYNGARIALSERGRELASLRVLGFTRREVAVLLFGEQALITALAIPMGWGIGYGLAYALMLAFRQETYRIPMVVTTETYLWSAVVVLAAAAVSGLIVRRRLDGLDLIEVLKTRE